VTDIDGLGDRAFMVTGSFRRDTVIVFIQGSRAVDIDAPSKAMTESLAKQFLAQIE
jgi:hypothetical protein